MEGKFFFSRRTCAATRLKTKGDRQGAEDAEEDAEGRMKGRSRRQVADANGEGGVTG